MTIAFWRTKQQQQQLFLAPLAPREGVFGKARAAARRIHPAAATVALSLSGGVAALALVFVLSGTDTDPSELAEAIFTPEVAQAAGLVEAKDAPVEEEVAAVTAADLPAMEPDPAETASIATPQPVNLPPVGTPLALMPAASANAAVAALNALQSDDSHVVPIPTRKPDLPATTVAAAAPAATRQAITNRAVNMRASPREGSSVLGVIPAQTALQVEPGCEHWCAVSHDGRTGYIYKSFIGYR